MPRSRIPVYDSLHLTTVHTVDDIRVFKKECVTLAEAGFVVGLVVSTPKSERRQGLDIIAIRPAGTRLGRFTTSGLRMAWKAFTLESKLYHIHDPELLPLGVLLRMAGRKVIYDVHEDVPGQLLDKTWISPPLRSALSRAVGALEWVAGRLFNLIIAAGEDVGRRFPSSKTVVVGNYPRLAELVSASALPYPARPFLGAYIGGISRVRCIDELLDALDLVPDTVDARVALAGTFEPASLESECARKPAWHKMDALGWQSREQLAELLGRARFGIALLAPLPNHMEIRSNKLFEYMSAGIPVITSDFPSWRRFVDREGCGIAVDSSDAGAIARTILWFAEHPGEAEAMGRRGREAVRNKYNWESESQKLISAYERLLAR
jgi:glycosyltransferase involved in cell wall biosynthesis